ncbi:MAG: hypothetical protein WBIAU2_11650 [Wolbachia endosymbiont of Drosophila biauraria]|nr:MAG: hypothetical protein WBIAU2_11650 [Wolbachia endosymbiont of Drosophila biauraria]
MEGIEKKVLNLEKKALEELRKIWRKVFVEEAPRNSKKYLIPRLAHRLQEKAYGEISRKGAKRLKYLADRLEQGKRISSDKLPVDHPIPKKNVLTGSGFCCWKWLDYLSY